MRLLLVRLAAAAAVAYGLLSPSEASAKIALITSGDTIKDLGTAKAARGEIPAGMKVGYKYSYGGLFWIDFWTWDGTYCVYEDKNYMPISETDAAELLGKPGGSVGKPFLYRFPLGLLILGGIGLLVLIGAVAGRGKQPAAGAESENPYERMG